MMPWWDADLAGKGLRAGTLPPMTLPKPQDKRALNRRRFGFTSAQVEEDPDLAILCSQLESILSFFSSDINPERKGGCKQPVTLVKMAQVVRHFMGWLVEWTKHTTTGSRHTTHNLRMELLLNPTYLGEWMQHIIHTRGCSLATVLGYICSLCQVFQALKAILYGPATACTAQTTCRNLSPFHHQLRDDTPLFEKLLSSLQHIKRQVSAKVSCNRAAKQTYNTRTLLQLMAQNDREQLAKIPSPLKYGLFMEYATKLAEAWLRVFCLISDDTWTMLKGVSPFDVLDEAHHHIQARALFLVCRHIMASWWRVVQGGVDLPPLRPSMVRKLKRPDHQQCTHPHCQVQGCKGNLVVLPPPGADGMLMGFTISHYKSQGNTSMRNQMGAAHLPLPANSLAEQLTMALLDKVLPHLDSLGCSRSSAAAPPPSHHHHQGGAAAAASTEEEEEEEEEAPHLLHHNTNPPAHHFMLLDCWAPNQLPPSGKDTWELAGSSPAPPPSRGSPPALTPSGGRRWWLAATPSFHMSLTPSTHCSPSLSKSAPSSLGPSLLQRPGTALPLPLWSTGCPWLHSSRGRRLMCSPKSTSSVQGPMATLQRPWRPSMTGTMLAQGGEGGEFKPGRPKGEKRKRAFSHTHMCGAYAGTCS